MNRIKLLFIMCFITSVVFAQELRIRGVVADDSGGLPGASVIVKGSEKTSIVGTITDIDGAFELQVKIGDVVVVSFLGFDTQEFTIDERRSYDILLESDSKALEELVVVGYGVQKKKSSVAAISQTMGEDLLKVGSVNSVTEAIQGLMPGVTSISSGTGKPGADAGSILIRGMASWRDGGADPLILVDGVERDMDDVDPNEVENISVLKDASATAVFGVKGGNGVILITTKRGTISKPSVGFSANFGLKQPTSSPEYADYVTSMNMWNEAAANDQLWDKLIPQSTISAWENAYATGNYGPDNDYFPQVNWWDEMVKKVAYQQQYNVNLRGGTKFIKYFVSLGYLNDGDIFNSEPQEEYDPSSSYKRYNWRSNFDINLTKTTKLSANIAGNLGYRSQTGYRLDSGQEVYFYERIYSTSQNQYPIQWSNGEWAVNELGASNPYMDYQSGGQRMYKTYRGFLDFKLEQKLDFITPGLKAKGSFSFSNSSQYSSNILDATGTTYGSDVIAYSRIYDYTNPNADGTYPIASEVRWADADHQEQPVSASYDNLVGGSFVKKLYYEMALNYNRTFGDHTVSGLALFSRREKIPQSYNVEIRQEDWVGRATYSYKDRYLMEVNGSRNGSESFAPGMRFGNFYSGSMGWRISEEPFVKRIAGNFLSNLKVRYSYGTSGFDTGNDRFIYQQSYQTGPRVGDADQRYDLWLGDSQAVRYGTIYAEGDVANANATWETSIKQNLGIEFGIKSKLTGTIDLYTDRREGILMETWSAAWALPPGKSASGNIGETKNHGVELELKWNDRIGSDFRYWVKGNMALNENRIVAKGDGANTPNHLQEAGKPIGWTSTYINNGYYSSLDDIYNYATPVTESTQSQLVAGDMLYVDYNGDGVINDDDQVVQEDVKYPLSTAGLSFGVSYKGWAAHVLFYGVSGVSKNIPDMILYDNINGDDGIYLSSPNVTDRWTVDNASSALKPSLHTATGSDYSQSSSTYSYRDASYIRLKNAELSYSLQKKRLKKLKMSKLQLYVNGNNLFTFTNLDKRLDPEANSLSVYPMVKRYNFGVRASF